MEPFPRARALRLGLIALGVATLVVLSAWGLVHADVAAGFRPTGISLPGAPGLRLAANSSVEFSDDFENDTALNTSAWTVNGSVASGVLASQGAGGGPLSPVPPTLNFSGTQGLTLSNVTADLTYADIQTNASFLPPFEVQTNVDVTASHGVTFVFGISNAGLNQGLVIAGNLNASSGYLGIGAEANVGPGDPWNGVPPPLNLSPSMDEWYNLTIVVEANYEATAVLSHNGTILGGVSYLLSGAYYFVYLGQYVDSPAEGNGPNSASYQWLYVNSTAGVPPGPTVAGVVADPADIALGASTEIETFVVGGRAPLSVQYYGLPDGCPYENNLSFSCTPQRIGTYTIEVNVTDSLGRWSTGVTNLIVAPGPPPYIASFLATPPEIVLGSSTTFQTVVENGTAPLTESYSNLPRGCSSHSTLALACTPTAPGTYNVSLTVKDSLGRTVVATTNLTVVEGPPPTVVGFLAAPDAITLGEATSFNVYIANGTGPLSVAYQNLPPGCSSVQTVRLLCIPTVAGQYTVNVTVTDALGRTAQASTPLTVAAVPVVPIVIEDMFASPPSVTLGQSSVIAVVVTGGTLPLAYNYSGLPPGCVSLNASSLTCTSTQVGRYTVGVTVTDSKGHETQGETILNVTTAAKTSSGPTNGEFELALGIGAVGIAMGLVGIVLTIRRLGSPPKPS